MSENLSGHLLKEALRRLEKIEHVQQLLLQESSYIRETVRLRLQGPDDPQSATLFTSAMILDVNGDIDGLNWHYSEKDGDQCYRWSGPGLLSSIHLPLRRDAELNCEVIVGSFSAGVPEAIKIFIDGEFITAFSKALGNIRFTIPPAKKFQAHTEISFLTQRVTQPIAVGNSRRDERWLGFRLYGLQVFPAYNEE